MVRAGTPSRAGAANRSAGHDRVQRRARRDGGRAIIRRAPAGSRTRRHCRIQHSLGSHIPQS